MKFTPTWFCYVTVATVLTTVVGCGTGSMSQADMLRHGISRADEDEEEEESPPLVITTGPAATNNRPNLESNSSAQPTVASASDTAVTPEAVAQPSATAAPATAVPTPSVSAAPVAAQPVAAQPTAPISAQAIGSLVPVSDRGLSVSGDVSQRRGKSASNLETISQALTQWIANANRLETNTIRNAQGRPILSWRVKILPLLGYSDLYKQFDQTQPWDHPNNKRLLQYIPPEFTSPERNDTNTNYQLFVGRQALFSPKDLRFKSDISDEPHILMLAEVDDAIAVPWTSPFDYEVDFNKPFGEGLGGLRSDGFFFAWMSGQVSLWPNPIDKEHLRRAITFEAGDSFPMARYQNYPPLGGASSRPSLGDASPASVASSGTLGSQPLGSQSLAPRAGGTSPNTPNSNVAISSAPIPPADAVLASEQKVRTTYEDAFKKARSAPEFAKLAKDMHRQMTDAAMPAADTYVGLRTAVNIAVKGRDPKLALKISDDLISRFDVSRAEVEAKIIDGFLGDGGSLRTQLSKAAELLPTIEMLINQDIRQDDFRSANEKAKQAQIVLRTISDPETKYRWKVLRQRIDEGKRQLSRVAKDMEVLASDPSNAEANASIGWYFCVIKNNWREGLEMLAKTEDPELRALAQLETQEDASRNRAIQLGDGWWNYATEKKDDDLVFEAAMQRSRLWYSTAAVSLSDGLDRIRANDRVERINRMIGELPDLAGTPYSAL